MATRAVLHVNEAEEQADYMEAVSEVIRRVLTEQGETIIGIAERINVTSVTISNAFNKKSCLSPVYLKRLGKAYGPHTLDPYLKLIGARAVPLEISMQRDVLPFVGRVNLKIAQARSPESPGGIREIHTEKADYLPDLRSLRKELDVMICQIEAELAA